ncbi:MAG: PH domain-containing protein [Dehalococcoidia bacterium]|nr:PH domain-containing protein [Dehalococcoidia bacterium]
MVFRPPRLTPVLVGASVVLALLAAVGAAAVEVLGSPAVTLSSFFLGIFAFGFLLLAVLASWRTYACWALRYHLTRDALTIHWAFRTVVVPICSIAELASSQGKGIRWVRGFHWYAYHVAAGMVKGIGVTQFYATHLSSRNLVYVVVEGGSYGITPDSPQRFARSLETCRRLGSLSEQKARVEESAVVNLPVWRDSWVLGLFLCGFLVNLALFAYLSHLYPSIPTLLSLHFAPNGQVDRVGMKLEIFKLPAMALVVLGGNGVAGLLLHLKERYMALLVLGVALLVQILFWLAAMQIVK